MRILYGVVGEGMGHATRSLVVLRHLFAQGHEVRVVVSGRAHDFLAARLRAYPKTAIEEIHGLKLRYFGNRLSPSASLFWNLKKAPKGIRKNIKVYRKVAEDGFKPELVISDFESWAALYALSQRLPVISIDNMQIINRCKHQKEMTKGFDFRLARTAVKMKMPGAYHYLITSFFFPPVRRRYTSLVPPVLRPEVISAKRAPGKHIVVYLRPFTSERLLSTLEKLPYPFRVYGLEDGESSRNVTIRPFSDSGFLDDLRRARAVITGGGFSLMSEAVNLHVPVLSFPAPHQFEQELNARYLERFGYGTWSRSFHPDIIESFLRKTDEYAQALGGYERQDNSMTFACVDELIEHVRRREKRPQRLESAAMGKWNGEG